MEKALTLVMPVYNDGAAIAAVVREWAAVLRSLNVSFTLLVINDASTDQTGEALAGLRAELPELTVTQNPANRGHGGSILEGYRQARSEWIFQVDSDGEMKASDFNALWRMRNDYDFLLGFRTGRIASPGRRLISLVARASVNLLFGSGVVDANTPYRLMRTNALQEMLPLLPPEAFAPNVLLTGLAVRRHLRVYQTGIPYHVRRDRGSSLTGWKTWRAALRSFYQTLWTAAQR